MITWPPVTHLIIYTSFLKPETLTGALHSIVYDYLLNRFLSKVEGEGLWVRGEGLGFWD